MGILISTPSPSRGVVTWPSLRAHQHQDVTRCFRSMTSPSQCSLLFFHICLFIYLFFTPLELGFCICALQAIGADSLSAACTCSIHGVELPTSGRHPGCALHGWVQHLCVGGNLVRGHKSSWGYLHLHPAGAIARCLPQAWPWDVPQVCSGPSEMRGSSWLGSGN